ncbi:MAG: transposase [Myxococcota bacterium]
MVSRRCVGRMFRLVPLKPVNLILWYCLAVALSATGVEIHEFCFMSNHVHLVVTSTRGELPNFINRPN